jgi:multiple sugar transport system ATP-binding protein
LAEQGIPASVVVVEPTGAETELLLDVGKGAVTQRLTLVMHGRTQVRPGEAVYLDVDPVKAHVFDSASGQRID